MLLRGRIGALAIRYSWGGCSRVKDDLPLGKGSPGRTLFSLGAIGGGLIRPTHNLRTGESVSGLR